MILRSPAGRIARLLSLLFLAVPARAVDGAKPALAPAVALPGTEHRSITARKIGQVFDVFVSLPPDYATSAKSYPVLYGLDGWHFPLLAFLQNNNKYSERMPPVIMVNLGHVPATDAMKLRSRDFSPTPLADRPGSGGAAAFLDFLETELIPFIDGIYRTDPADRGLLGHSMGGMFALYALEQRPALFQRIVAASPAPLEWDHRAVHAAARRTLKALPSPVRLDLSVGNEPEYAPAVRAFAALLDELKPAGLEYRFTEFPAENHNSVRLASFPHGLSWVYRPAAAP
jgi:predicted alpha/beta superfamily hydrolase